MKISNNYTLYPSINFSGAPYYKIDGETPVDMADIIAREARYAAIQLGTEEAVISDEEDADDSLEQENNEEIDSETRKICAAEHAMGLMLIELQTKRLMNETPAPQPIMPTKTPIDTGRKKLDIKG